MRSRTVRDPLWQNIRLEPAATAIVDTPEFQRLRRVKQLGFAHLVYPGAVHTRFLHAIGVYHLTARAIEHLRENGDLDRLSAAEREAVPQIRLAALLHDVGHYAFSHAMEELGSETLPGHHEEVADRFLGAGPIRSVLSGVGSDSSRFIAALIRGASSHPLQGLVAGSLDLDKIDYLRRDSLFCGVPYGAVDVERLLDALTVVHEDGSERLEIGVTEKGVSALESLLFSKYEMFRNVYWHHGVRAATCTFRRLIERALSVGFLGQEELAGPTDEELLNLLAVRAADHSDRSPTRIPEPRTDRTAMPDDRLVREFLNALAHRRLPKRALEISGDALPTGIGEWISERPDLVRKLEERLANEWKLEPGCAMVDYPAYPGMLQLDLLLVRRDGCVQRLTSAGAEGIIDLPRLGRSLHHAARVFRVFTLGRVAPKDPAPLLELLEASPDEVQARLHSDRSLY